MDVKKNQSLTIITDNICLHVCRDSLYALYRHIMMISSSISIISHEVDKRDIPYRDDIRKSLFEKKDKDFEIIDLDE